VTSLFSQSAGDVYDSEMDGGLSSRVFVLLPPLSSSLRSLSSLSLQKYFPADVCALTDESSYTVSMDTFLSFLKSAAAPIQDETILMEYLILHDVISVFSISSSPSSQIADWNTSQMGVKVPLKLASRAAPPVRDTDKWCLHIHHTLSLLRSQVQKLEEEVQKTKDRIKEYLRDKKRDIAVLYLRKLKGVEKVLSLRTDSLFKLEEIQQAVHSAANAKMVLDALRIGAQALSHLNRDVNVSDVDQVMMDLESSIANQNEIADAMSLPIGDAVDEEELEDELSALMAAEEDDRQRNQERVRGEERQKEREKEKEEEEEGFVSQMSNLSIAFPSVPSNSLRRDMEAAE
jgi:hypothetical protein